MHKGVVGMWLFICLYVYQVGKRGCMWGEELACGVELCRSLLLQPISGGALAFCASPKSCRLLCSPIVSRRWRTFAGDLAEGLADGAPELHIGV